MKNTQANESKTRIATPGDDRSTDMDFKPITLRSTSTESTASGIDPSLYPKEEPKSDLELTGAAAEERNKSIVEKKPSYIQSKLGITEICLGSWISFFITTICFIVGFSLPEWGFTTDKNGTEFSHGLWQYPASHGIYIHGVQKMACSAFLFMALGAALLGRGTKMCRLSRSLWLYGASIAFFLAGVCNAFALIIYTTKSIYRQTETYHSSAAFDAFAVSSAGLFATTLLCFLDGFLHRKLSEAYDNESYERLE